MIQPILLITSIVCLLFLLSCSQEEEIQPTNRIPTSFPDEVFFVRYGTGAGFGHTYFPSNILGAPDTSARATVPSANEREILTLGFGGEIILKFLDGGIRNGQGLDFTIFENAFLHTVSLQVFRETALVAVSEDGINWIQFPVDSLSFRGLAGVTPTNGDKDYYNPMESGGDSFDLSDVGLERAIYLKITDAGDLIRDSGPSFDLDAIVVLNGEGR